MTSTHNNVRLLASCGDSIHAAAVVDLIMKGPFMLTLSELQSIATLSSLALSAWVYMPMLDVQEPCACRTSQGFYHACSHQVVRLTSPRGRSRSHRHRALTLTTDPSCHMRPDAAHRVHPDFRSCHLRERRKWISAAISLILNIPQ
jgi:hypothetical protein